METVHNDDQQVIVGEIPYLNTLPIFTVLRKHFPLSRITFSIGHPSELNEMLREGKVDVSPSSSIEFGRNPDLYQIVPDISISSKVKVKSVLLFSPFPIEEEKDLSVFATDHSSTSVSLVKIILNTFMGKRAHVVCSPNPRKDAGEARAPFLLIGDEAIRVSLENAERRFLHEYDLGELWHRYTGKPFVFALWIVSRISWEKKTRAMKKFTRMLLDAKKISLQMIRYRDGRIPSPDWIPSSFLHEYWSNLSYDLDEEIEGLELFYSLSHDAGILPDRPTLSFVPFP